MNGFLERAFDWAERCFTNTTLLNKTERCARFLEEALELVQSLDLAKDKALALVEYVYNRPTGEPRQELGGVQVTLAVLCIVHGFDPDVWGEIELARCEKMIEKIRTKQLAKELRGI
jgi:hypothetical protein